jgi:PST family polysaccharide transporter
VGADFGPAVIVLRILSLLPPLLAITHSVGLQWLLPLGRDAEVNRVVLTTGAFNLVLAVLLAPHFAHEGMAWAVVCSEALACASLVILTVRSMSRLRPIRFTEPAVSQTFET